MRLLNARTRKLKEFMGCDSAPPYAILSHTWGEEEVSCHDICDGDGAWRFGFKEEWKGKEGGFKIRNCCEQAVRDGLEWVWIDT